MSHVRKNQLSTDHDWRQHLRPIGKRIFWKSERRAHKAAVTQQLAERIKGAPGGA